MELVHHLKHSHPLVLSEEKYDEILRCSVCQDCIAGLCYCCNDCAFVLHKWCAELPLEVTNHPLHPDHTRLVLLSAEERAARVSATCQDCENEINISYAFSCSECSFILHPECALLPKKLEFEFNDADSLPVRKKLTFKKRSGGWSPCAVCKQGLENSWFAKKNDDSNSFHIQCAMLPRTVKHDRHIHDLALHVDIEKDKRYHGCYCDLCEEERDPNQWLYYCASCEVAGHLSCGLLGRVPPSKGILTSNRVYTIEKGELEVDDDIEESMPMVLRRRLEAAEREPLGELVHFSHEHPLLLYDDVWDGLHTCRACDICIYGKTYICAGCKFSLHKWCAELPQEVHFGFHLEHPLTLLPTHSLDCSYCRSDNHTFSFSCLECDFGVHTTCAFLSEFEQHKSHCHPLQVIIFTSYEHDWGFIGKIPVRSRQMPPCDSCQFPCMGMSLGCDDCDFYLHVGCSFYPPTGKAKTHAHNLNLTYDFQEDPRYDEFICDACEKPRTPNCWVYCCPDPKCEIVSHLDCAVPNLFSTSSSEQILKHEDDNTACSCNDCEKERDPNDWIYYRPSPSLHLLNNLQVPESDRPIQRILKSDPMYSFLRGIVVAQNVPKVEELQHFSHRHPLVLCNEKWNDAIKCEACNRGTYGKTYVCRECGYYLHKWCAQIPQQMHFKFHPEHPLTIKPGHDFECSVCVTKSFGFSFSCEKCDLEAHTLCALIPERDLESHKHSVDMVLYMPYESNSITACKFPVKNGQNPPCKACRFPCEGMTIECERCKFYLHISCAWYLRTSNIEAHTHTLTLDDSADFPVEVIPISYRNFCDVCDKALTQDCWGYLCTDEKCNLTAAHVDCAVPNPFLTSSFESILVHEEE